MKFFRFWSFRFVSRMFRLQLVFFCLAPRDGVALASRWREKKMRRVDHEVERRARRRRRGEEWRCRRDARKMTLARRQCVTGICVFRGAVGLGWIARASRATRWFRCWRCWRCGLRRRGCHTWSCGSRGRSRTAWSSSCTCWERRAQPTWNVRKGTL